MNVCTIRVGPSSAETLARFHLGQPPVDPGAIGLGRSDAHAWSGQTLAVIAGFGPRSAVLPNCPAVAVRPSMAQSDLANADEVRGCVAIVHRGADVPLVLKARRSAQAGAKAVIIVNSDDKPLVADAHHYPDGRADTGDDITIPVLAVPSSAAAMLESIGAGISLDYNTATTSPINVKDYESTLHATTQARMPEGVPNRNQREDTVTSINQALQGANDSLLGMQQQMQQDQVQEQWSTEQLAEARRRAEVELAEMRSRLGGGGSGGGGDSGGLGGHLAAGIADAAGVQPQPVHLQTPAQQPAPPPGSYVATGQSSFTGSGDAHGVAADVEALRALVSAEAESELRDTRARLAAAEQQLFSTKSDLASSKGEALALLKERDDERRRVHSLQLEVESANVSKQVSSADLEVTREQQKARAAEAIENAARLQRSQASLSAEIARRRSTEAALDEATALNRELQAEKAATSQALLGAQENAVKMEETRAQSDARMDHRLAAAQQEAAEAQESRREAEAALERVRSDLGEQMATAMDASKAAMDDIRRMQKEDEERLAAALETIARLEAAVADQAETQQQLEDGREAIAAAAATASEDASAAISALEAQRVKDSEQAAQQLASSQAEVLRLTEGFAETKAALEAAERTNTAHEQREVALTAELRVARAEANAALESSKAAVNGEQEASQLMQARLKQAHEQELEALRQTQARQAQAHQLELEALRRGSEDKLAAQTVQIEAEAAERLEAALREQRVGGAERLSAAMREHELAVRVARVEAEAEAAATTEARATSTAQQVALEHQEQCAALRAEKVAFEEKMAAQMAELERAKAVEIEQLVKAEAQKAEMVQLGAKEDLAEAAHREAVSTGRLETALDAERTTHHACAAKLAGLEQSIAEREAKALTTAQEMADLRAQLGAAEKAIPDAQSEVRVAQGQRKAAEQRLALVEAAAEERGRLAEERGRANQERVVELEDQLRELIAVTQEKNEQDALAKADADSSVEQKDAQLAKLRRELVQTQETLVAVQIESGQAVGNLEQAAAAAIKQALEDAELRSQQAEVALRSEYESEINQGRASNRAAELRKEQAQEALTERAELAE